MLTDYIDAAMKRAQYEILEDGTYFGEIPELEGLWANAKTLEACREELQSGLEDWILMGVQFGDLIPVVEGIDLNVAGLDFEDSHAGSKHEFMRGRGKRVILPNPYEDDISISLLASILRKAGISREEWEKL